jgi:hypothetical protein
MIEYFYLKNIKDKLFLLKPSLIFNLENFRNDISVK